MGQEEIPIENEAGEKPVEAPADGGARTKEKEERLKKLRRQQIEPNFNESHSDELRELYEQEEAAKTQALSAAEFEEWLELSKGINWTPKDSVRFLELDGRKKRSEKPRKSLFYH